MTRTAAVAASMALAVVLGAIDVAAGPPPAAAHAGDAFQYARNQPNLCRNINNKVHVHVTPYRIAVRSVRGTNDFVDDRNGYSLRTCDWKARAGSVYYRCNRARRSGTWTLAVIGSAEQGSKTRRRLVTTMVCAKGWQKVNYAFYGRSYVHVHVWAPTASSTLSGVEVSIPAQ